MSFSYFIYHNYISLPQDCINGVKMTHIYFLWKCYLTVHFDVFDNNNNDDDVGNILSVCKEHFHIICEKCGEWNLNVFSLMRKVIKTKSRQLSNIL